MIVAALILPILYMLRLNKGNDVLACLWQPATQEDQNDIAQEAASLEDESTQNSVGEK